MNTKQTVLAAVLSTGFFLAQTSQPLVASPSPATPEPAEWCNSWLSPVEWAAAERDRGVSITNAFRSFLGDDFTSEADKRTMGRIVGWVYTYSAKSSDELRGDWLVGCYRELGVGPDSPGDPS